MTTTTLPAHRFRGMKCLTPKSPDEPARVTSKLCERTWSVAYDPDGTFPPGNRIGTAEVYYGLRNWNFTPGTELLQLYNSDGDKRHRIWIVALRHNASLGDFLDAYSQVKIDKYRTATHWIMQTVFRRMSTAHSQPVDSEQMVMDYV